MYEQLVKRTTHAGKIPFVLSRAVEDFDHDWYRLFDELATPFLPSYRPALAALSQLGAWGTRVQPASPISVSAIPVAPCGPANPVVMDWDVTQRVLADAGIPYSAARLVGDADGAVTAAGELGYPVAVKLYARNAPHK